MKQDTQNGMKRVNGSVNLGLMLVIIINNNNKQRWNKDKFRCECK